MRDRALGVSLVVALVVLTGAAPRQDDKKRIEELERRVVELEKRIVALEQQLAKGGERDRLACKRLIEALSQAVWRYYNDHKAFPLTGNLAGWLAPKDPKQRQYFEFGKDQLNGLHEAMDPWGNALVYRNNATNYPRNKDDLGAHNKQSFDLYSFGPDGKDDKGDGDDITNWK